MDRTREGVAILLSNFTVYYSVVKDFGCVSSRNLWSKFKFSRVKVSMALGYSPNEGIGEERKRFWNVMDRTMGRVQNGYRLCMLGELNGWNGDRVKAGITGAFGVP